MSEASRQPISYSDVAPEEIPEIALPDPNFVAELRESKGSNKHKKQAKKHKKQHKKQTDIDQMSQYYDEIDAGAGVQDDNEEGAYENEDEDIAEAAFIDGDLSVWDDRVLLEAWDAANEEYRLLHGDKSWKTDPDHQLETPSMIWYDSGTDLGKIAAKQSAKKAVATTRRQNKRKRSSSEGVEEVEADTEVRVETDKGATEETGTTANATTPSQIDNTTINTGDPGKDYVLHQLSQAWYAAGYWTGILHQKYGETAH